MTLHEKQKFEVAELQFLAWDLLHGGIAPFNPPRGEKASSNCAFHAYLFELILTLMEWSHSNLQIAGHGKESQNWKSLLIFAQGYNVH